MKRKNDYVHVMWKYATIASLVVVLVMGLLLVQYHNYKMPDIVCVELEFAE
jgi:uncharacterized membrane-anchored protein YhcB (DUF1043 family)